MRDVDKRKEVLLAAGVLVFVGKYFLVLFRKKDSTWGIPGGKIEAHETPSSAAIREMSEEINLACSGDDMKFVGDYFHAGSQFNVFEIRFSEYPDISVDTREHSSYRWVEFEQFVLEDDPASSSLISLLRDMQYC